MKCVSHHPGESRDATGYVRYVDASGAEEISGPACDSCQATICTSMRALERKGAISQLGAIPLDYRERMNEAARGGAARRIAQEIERAPGAQDEIAAMIVEALDALPKHGRHYGVKLTVLAMLQRWAEDQDEGRAAMLSEIDPEDIF